MCSRKIGSVTLANALISGYMCKCERREMSDNRRPYLVVLHTTSRVDEYYIETMLFCCTWGQFKR